MNSHREFILYSCRNLKLLQKCNVVLNYAETFYKSNVNCTFLYKINQKRHLDMFHLGEEPLRVGVKCGGFLFVCSGDIKPVRKMI